MKKPAKRIADEAAKCEAEKKRIADETAKHETEEKIRLAKEALKQFKEISTDDQ